MCLTEAKAALTLRKYCTNTTWTQGDKQSQPDITSTPLGSKCTTYKLQVKWCTIQLRLQHFLSAMSNASCSPLDSFKGGIGDMTLTHVMSPNLAPDQSVRNSVALKCHCRDVAVSDLLSIELIICLHKLLCPNITPLRDWDPRWFSFNPDSQKHWGTKM